MAEGRIFISYRRGPDNDAAARLYDQLARHFDEDRLVFDIDVIPLGYDFHDFLEGAVGGCAAFLAVIGPGWAAAVDRLQNESDWVRIEIAAALGRGEVPVIPVFVNDARMPMVHELPDDLMKLPRRNGIEIPHAHFNAVVARRLVTALAEVLDRDDPTIPKAAETPAPYVAKPEPEKPALPEPGTIFRDVQEPWCPEMVVIPTGTFLMGSTDAEAKKCDVPDEFAAWERPRHEVEISKPFALARYTTTFGEYDAFCEATDRDKPKDEGWGRDRRPAINVTWHDAVAYCEWLSEQTGHTFRLPSEAEWEYACRAGTKTAFSFGDVISTNLANYDGNDTAGGSDKGEFRERTLPVDYPGFEPNAFGLWQMHGNVWEWCADHFADNYETPRRQVPFTASQSDTLRVLRGGSWLNYPQGLRSALRSRNAPGDRYRGIGFRPARTLLTP
ncbi:MAG: SUMF1/EgtB/PvdO family nonheme iron enzyme [Pseudomonadota bacterium]